jgi:hypothetical protein
VLKVLDNFKANPLVHDRVPLRKQSGQMFELFTGKEALLPEAAEFVGVTTRPLIGHDEMMGDLESVGQDEHSGVSS